MSLDISYSGGVFSATRAKNVGTVTSTSGDPNFTNVSLLLDGDGTSGSTNITDKSLNSESITVNGNTQIDTAIKKFGTGSIEFDGTNSNLTLGSGLIGSGDWTIEYFVYGDPNSANTSFRHFYFSGTNTLQIYYIGASTTSAKDYSINVYDNNAGNQGSDNSLSLANYRGNWNHVAVVKSSTINSGGPGIGLFLNGTKISSVNTQLDFTDASLTIGSTNTSTSWFYGYLDEIRITNGVALYSSNFTVPTSAFPTTAPTVNLDLSTGNYFSHTPSTNVSINFTNPPASGTGTAAGAALVLTGGNAAETYDIANASYDSVSFSVASQETVPNNIGFNDDGTSMYIIGSDTDAIYQYTLSTAWDLSTASYASKSFSTTDDVVPRDFTFNNDGTKLYYVGSSSDTVYQYSLSTAYDISTASTDNKSLSVGTQASTPTGVELKSDGTKLYISDGNTDAIYQYSLSTAFDVSTGSYDSVSFSFSSQGTNTQSIFFTPSGTSLFVCDTANDAVYKYSLSTAWDVSTLSYANESFSLSGQDDPFGVAFKADGTKMYMVGITNDTVYQYTTGSVSAATITYPSSVKFAGGGVAPASPAVDETDVLVFYTDDGGTTYQGFQGGDAMA